MLQHANSDLTANQHPEAMDYWGKTLFIPKQWGKCSGKEKKETGIEGLTLFYSQEAFSHR